MPRAYLIRRGTILWEGHPEELPPSRIEEALAGTVLEPDWDLPPGFDRIRAALHRKLFGLAARALADRGAAGGSEGQVAGRAIERVRGYAEAITRELRVCASSGDPLLAFRSARSYAAAFGDWEGAAPLRGLIEGWERDPSLAIEREISSIIDRASDLVREGQIEAARALLLETAKAHPDARGAARARAFAGRFVDWR